MLYMPEKIKKLQQREPRIKILRQPSVQFLELERIDKEANKNFLVAFLFHCDSPQES
jgi:hypothetical protein